ncbi:hypothetical protein BO94DRAFT_49816 [Aspergillus sclerotioniger CBS 115572]|uniref:Uncharacterized protein n=1 Tax=Aspergillus sclerotioniger CBS 115572 TaxID=1450535 RepID=A0A317WSM4_9EURO|nr:hypothetical protein BO94DRAFT_49816 [Aspergillus sclerotioniger CBS 115572]PWY88731.1 hypothetical protein BO94DRAFT_49816 [Aspergillus sclerotioniger CBS 115572]
MGSVRRRDSELIVRNDAEDVVSPLHILSLGGTKIGCTRPSGWRTVYCPTAILLGMIGIIIIEVCYAAGWQGVSETALQEIARSGEWNGTDSILHR